MSSSLEGIQVSFERMKGCFESVVDSVGQIQSSFAKVQGSLKGFQLMLSSFEGIHVSFERMKGCLESILDFFGKIEGSLVRM